jgi:hypothetical protein
MAHKSLEIDMIAGTQIRDSAGEILDIAGADISKLTYLNDNHGSTMYNRLGYVTESKKIMVEGDCDNERHKHYWDLVKSPYIYVKGKLYDSDDHPNARACAAILRNVHRDDIPYKMKASVEGATIARGTADPSILARTKIVGVALTFTPANHATLVEPVSLIKTEGNWEKDKYLIESIAHLAKADVPNFRHIERKASASFIVDKLSEIKSLAEQLGIPLDTLLPAADDLIQGAIETKVANNINKISEAVSELSKSNYGPKGAGLYNPTDNIKRKANRTGEELKNVGQNIAVHEYTSATMGTAKQQANKEAKEAKVKNAKQPVKIFTPEEKAKLQTEYDAKLNKAMTAGYGGGVPTSATGGLVLQTESLEPNKFKFITCRDCGDEQIHSKFQVKCRKCNKNFAMEQLAKLFGHD